TSPSPLLSLGCRSGSLCRVRFFLYPSWNDTLFGMGVRNISYYLGSDVQLLFRALKEDGKGKN
ncbi:MAG: hypothetical protein PHR16_05260, partial [Methylovulum sp.]|nr:hypothetical protein [Methylovulum sp.]